MSIILYSADSEPGRHRRKNMTATIGLVVHAAGEQLNCEVCVSFVPGSRRGYSLYSGSD